MTGENTQVDSPSPLGVLAQQLDRLDVPYQLTEGTAVVVLPGRRKLKTICGLTPSRDSLRVEAFVCRCPEENHAGVHKWLLQRNRRLFGISYTIDAQGDIYLVGQLPPLLDDADLDRLLGQVLETADGDFNLILERGFASSIKREWAWRVDRGESLANLEQFRHLAKSGDK
ncbi:YbjN domain-containing protein [Corynebacterium sp. H78]|uniref:YbjN domain-containing protein n=1 Tax=Corynebacterium sp. H78 TaxID=3133417 RepID=UPI0030B7049D